MLLIYEPCALNLKRQNEYLLSLIIEEYQRRIGRNKVGGAVSTIQIK